MTVNPSSEALAAQTALLQSQRRMGALVEQSPVAIQVFRPDGSSLSANAAWERLWGASRDHLEGYNVLTDLQLERKGVLPLICEAFAGRTVRLPATRYDPAEIGKPGRARWVEGLAYPVLQDGGGLQEVVLLLQDVTDRVDAEELARRNEIRYRALIEASAQIVWSTDAAGNVVEDVPAWRELTGQSFEQMRGNGWTEVVHPQDRDRAREIWDRSTRGETPHSLQVRVRTASGEYRFVDVRAVPVFDSEGRVAEWVGTCSELGEEHLTDRLLASQAEALKSIVLGEPLEQVLSQLCRIVEELSPAESAASILMLRDGSLWHGAAPSLPDTYNQAIDGVKIGPTVGTCGVAAFDNRSVITPSLRKAPTWQPFLNLTEPVGLKSAWSMPIVGSDGQVLGTLGTYFREERVPSEREQRIAEVLARTAAIAIERRIADEELRARTTALETVNAIGQTLASELDLQRLTQALTDAATEITGAEFGAFFYNVIDHNNESYMLYTLSGVPLEAFSKFPMPRNTEVFAPTFAGEGVVRIADVTKDPRYGQNPPYHGMPEGHLPVRSYLAIPVASQSEVIGGLFFGHSEPGVFTDLHEQMLLGIASQAAVAMENARLYNRLNALNSDLERRVHERTAELVAANEEMEGFTYTIAHDLRAPLRGINASSNILLEDHGPELSEPLQAELRRQADNALRLAQLIDDLLKLSRLGRQEIEVASIDLSAMATEVGETVDADVDVEPGLAAQGDPNLVRMALQNLIENAAKFARTGVRARIYVGQDSHGAFYVRDNGIGFEREYAEVIFRPFERLHRDAQFPGTGIGLANVKRAIERLNGRVWARSEPGVGSTFFFTLPGTQEAHEERQQSR